MALPNNAPQHRTNKNEDNILIAVMGATGTGKSSIIKLLTGDPNIKIGNSLKSETQDIKEYPFVDQASGRSVAIVDTPGFDDSRPDITDTEILRRITKFLLDAYDEDRKLNGIIYLHRISDPRFSGQSARTLRLFKELCGKQTFENVVVFTTFWDEISSVETGVEREAQLKTDFCKALADGGAVFMRYDLTPASVDRVLGHIYTLTPKYARITEEIRVEGKELGDTGAGTMHHEEAERMIAKHKQELAELKAELDEVKKADEALRRELEEERAGLQEKLARWETERLELKKGLEESRKQLSAQAELAHRRGTNEPLGDILIAVMGSTGSGKSSFVKLLTGDSSIKIGNSLEPGTVDVKEYRFSDRARKIVIIDTPGFVDSRMELTDTESLQKITDFLFNSHKNGRKLDGIIYLHRISANLRSSRQPVDNLRTIKCICGKNTFKNFVIVTTHWDQLTTSSSQEEGVRREAQLKTMFCQDLGIEGTAFVQHDRTLESARRVLDHIIRVDTEDPSDPRKVSGERN